MHYLQSLQRKAGNSAVGVFLSQNARPLATHRPRPVNWLSVQSCGPDPCNCAGTRDEIPEEQPPRPLQAQRIADAVSVSPTPRDGQPGTLTLQRDLSDVAAAVLPSWVTDLVTGAPAHAHDLAGEVTNKGETSISDAKARAGQSAAESRAGAESLTRAGKRQADERAQQAAQDTASARESANASAASAEGPAAHLGNASSAAGALVNPVGPIVGLPGFQDAVTYISSLLSALPGGVADLASDIKRAFTEGLKAGHTDGWDCDQSEIMAIAGGVERAVADAATKAGKKILGEDRYRALSDWVHARIEDIKAVAATVKEMVKAIETKIKEWWDAHIAPLISEIQSMIETLKQVWEQIKKTISDAINTLVTAITEAIEAIKKNVIDPVVTFAKKAAETVTGIYNDVRAKLASWWNHIPSFAQKVILGIGAIITGPVGLVVAGAMKAAEFLAAHKSDLLAGLKKLADALFQQIAKTYNFLKAQATNFIKSIKERGRKLIDSIKAGARKIYDAIDTATGHRLSTLLAALAAMRKKISGEICTAIGAIAGPCIDQFVPDPGKNAKEGDSSDITLTTGEEVTVPIDDVPVKIGQGASVKLSRRGTDYTVTLEGNGLLAVVTPKPEDPNAPPTSTTDVNVQGFGPVGKMLAAWKAITAQGGAAPPPGAPAPAPAPGGAGPAGPAPTPVGPIPGSSGDGAQAEAGIKCSVAMSFGFDGSGGKDADGKGSTCNGLGGLSVFLAAAGLSYTLPPPFSYLVGAATQTSFAENVTACTVTLDAYGKAQVDLLKTGFGGVNAAINSETSVTATHALVDPKDPTKGWQDSATLTDTLGGSIAAQIALGGADPLNLAGVGGSAGVSASLFITLVYSEKLDKISAASAGAKLSFSLGLSRAQVTSTLPEHIAARVLPEIEPLIEGANQGVLTVSAQVSIENLQDLAGQLDAYFANPAAVTGAGVIKIVADHFSTAGNIKKVVTVSLTVTKILGKVEVSEKDKDASAKASVGLEEHQTKVLYP